MIQADTAVRTAADILAFGKANELAAAADATLGIGDGDTWRARYEDDLAKQQARDGYDRQNRKFARGVGQVAGAGLGIAFLTRRGFGPAIIPKIVPDGAKIIRLARPVRRLGYDTRGLNAIAAVGGGTLGVLGQSLSDAAEQKISSAGDYAGAAIGGVADGLGARRLGPVVGAALGGATTTGAQSAFDGRMPTLNDMGTDAFRQATHARVGNAVGTYGSSALSRYAKGLLGEAMSYPMTVARGEGFPSTQIDVPLKRGFTKADQWLRKLDKIVEDKFGPYPSLSDAQKRARTQYGDRYQIINSQPRDFGKVIGVAASEGGGASGRRERR